MERAIDGRLARATRRITNVVIVKAIRTTTPAANEKRAGSRERFSAHI
jgi:hypothetical protein